ncbi:MAG: iron-containing alcohol dehydrogenase [Bacteroidota bacterium]
MENFIYYNPVKILFGKDTINELGFEIKKAAYERVLLLAGGGSIKTNGVYEQVCESLKSEEIDWVEKWGVRPNPILSHAREAIDIAKNENIEAVIAVGGGSVIDEAKAVAAGFYLKDVWQAYEGKRRVKEALPIFTVLTLSATGSEMNSFSVLTNEEENKKWSMGGKPLFPKVSIIDPSVQMSLPERQTINGGIDALSHIMEYYFQGSSKEYTSELAEAMMRSVINSVDELKKDPANYQSRANLCWGASLALNGLTGAGMQKGEWAVHGIEHGISALFPNVAHAEGLAVLFPAWISYVKDFNKPQFEKWAKNVWNADTIDVAIEKMISKFMEWDAPVKLGDLGIASHDIPAIADNSLMKSGELGNLNKLKRDDIINILRLAL